MKKRALITVMLLALMLFAFSACSKNGNASYNGTAVMSAEAVSPKSIEANIEYFLGITRDDNGEFINKYGDIGNRTPTSESEKAAAKRLYDKYADKEKYPSAEVKNLEFETTSNDVTRTSQNVEVKIRGTGGSGQVIIGAGYDNSYGSYDAKYEGQNSTGAFANGTGVAVVMSLIDYVTATESALNLEFDIVFVFYGANTYNGEGTEQYISKFMTAEERLNTLVAFDIERLGGDRTYLYTDEVKTEHGELINSVANKLDYNLYSMPKSTPIISGMFREDIYYAHYAMLGSNASYLDWGIPAAHIFSGYYGGFNLAELECKGDYILSGTEDDTYINLNKKRPGYKEQGAAAASIIIGAITDESFASALKTERDNMGGYAFWANPFWAYIICIGIIIILSVVVIVLVKHFEKKYPFKPTFKRLKLAVFGMEHENPEQGDIYVDIKKKGNPFDGY